MASNIRLFNLCENQKDLEIKIIVEISNKYKIMDKKANIGKLMQEASTKFRDNKQKGYKKDLPKLN